jgi:hypothetical protein
MNSQDSQYWGLINSYLNHDYTLFAGVLLVLVSPWYKFFYLEFSAFCIFIMWVIFIWVLWVFLYSHWWLELVLLDDLCRLAYLNFTLHILLLNYVYDDILLDTLHLTLVLLLYLVWSKAWRGELLLKSKSKPLPVWYYFVRGWVLSIPLFERFWVFWR